MNSSDRNQTNFLRYEHIPYLVVNTLGTVVGVLGI